VLRTETVFFSDIQGRRLHYNRMIGHGSTGVKTTSTSSTLVSGEPVLSEEQREALNAALSGSFGGDAAAAVAATQDEVVLLRGVPPPLSPKGSQGKGASSFQLQRSASSGKGPVYHDHHLSRKGKGSGKAKKNGGGGKFTWGTMLDVHDDYGVADEGDPNWDSQEEDMEGVKLVEARLVEIVAYKDAVVDILTEYFESGDDEEAAQSVEELDHAELGHYFVKKAITCSLDRHDKEREMISRLLSSMYGGSTIDLSQMEKGFVAVLDSLDDLVLDVPRAVEWVSQFTCRAIADDILAPSFVTETEPFGSDYVTQWHTLCSTYLSDPHFAERMSRVWGSRAGLDVKETKMSFDGAIKEYISAQDVAEVRRVIQSLAVPHYHHEFVKLAVQACFENSDALESLVGLLSGLISTGDVNKSQTVLGLRRVCNDIDQITLDYPNARVLLGQILDEAKKRSWISDEEHDGLVAKLEQGVVSKKVFTVSEFKGECKTTIMEYFDSADQSEVECQLNQCGDPGLHSIFVKMLIQMAMDRNDREREMASSLLNDLAQGSVVSEEQLSLGFKKLLSSVEDMTLDIPDAPRFLTLFIGRAIVDEAVPPSFLSHSEQLKEHSLGIDIIHAARKLLAAKHSAERFTNCWHGYSPKETSEVLTRAFKTMIQEYMVSKNFNELLKCLGDVGMPHYHHEIVYQCILHMLEDPTTQEAIHELLAKLFICGEINVTQVSIAYDRLLEDGDDLELDYIGAKERIAVTGKIFKMFGMI
jgi:hypothetical protein